jgi:hypothetical protein
VEPLRGIGYWRNDTHPELPDPRDFVDPNWDQGTRDDIVDYLRRGLLARVFMGYSSCRICGKRDNGDLEQTDGTYLWPSGLAHYVSDHLVRLPEEFVCHVRDVTVSNEEAPVDWVWWSRQQLGS